jgi:uncharacterized caspase-like protein/TolB-like protein
MQKFLVIAFYTSFVLVSSVYIAIPCAFAASTSQGTLWVFTVGVSQYRNPSVFLRNLQHADNDAEALAKVFQTYSGQLFRSVHTKVLINQEATRQTILNEMRSFFAQAGSSDVAIVALTGHGVAQGGSYYFLPHPADGANLLTEGLSLVEFEAEITKIAQRVQYILIAIDSCHAGAVKISELGARTRQDGEKQLVASNVAVGINPTIDGMYILSSSKANELSYEWKKWSLSGEDVKGHGAFTYILLRGLSGEAADRDGMVKVLNLFDFVSREVPKLPKPGPQTPYFRGIGTTNFALTATPLPASPDAVRKANALLQEGRIYQQQGELNRAEQAFVAAQQINPRDELPPLLYQQVKEEKAYRSNPQQQRDVLDEAIKLVKEKGKRPSVNPWDPQPLVITFFDFSTLGSGQERAGLHEVLVQRVAQSLAGTRRVQVVDRRLLDKVLEGLKLSMSNLVDPSTQLRIGRILTARLIAVGDIVFVSDQRLAFNLRMIDTETTAITVLSKDGTDPEKLLAFADEIAAAISDHLRREYPIRGILHQVEGDEVILNVGTNHGIVPGIRMKAIIEEPIVIGGEIVARKKKDVGTIEITEVYEKASFGQIVERKGPVQQGTKVIEVLNSPSAASKTNL